MPDLTELFREVTEVTKQASKIQALAAEIDAIPEGMLDIRDAAYLSMYLNVAADTLTKVRQMASYMFRPIVETSRLWKNGSGDYETTAGFCFREGSPIVVLVPSKYSTDSSYWERSYLQHDGKGYYLAGYPELSLEGLAVRVRKGDQP